MGRKSNAGIEDTHNALLRLRDRISDPDSTLFNARLNEKVCTRKHLIANILSDVEWMFQEQNRETFSLQEERASLLEEAVELIVTGESLQSFLRRGIGNYFKNGVEHRRKDLEKLMWDLIGLHDYCEDDSCLRQPGTTDPAMKSASKRRKIDIKEDQIGFFEAIRENVDYVAENMEAWEPSVKNTGVHGIVIKIKPLIQEEITQLLLHRKHITLDILDQVIKNGIQRREVFRYGTRSKVRADVVSFLEESMKTPSNLLGSVIDTVLRSHEIYCNETCKEEGKWDVPAKRRRLF